MGGWVPEEEAKVKCVICRHGETLPGKVSSMLERDGTTVVFRDVPAEVCQNCGEEYFSRETTERLLQLGEEAIQTGVQVVIREYVAA